VRGDIDDRHAAFADLRDDGVVVNLFARSHIVQSLISRLSASVLKRFLSFGYSSTPPRFAVCGLR
jgi:hypothetical protein